MTGTVESRLPRECTNCGTVMLYRHPERPGGLTHYCLQCDEHVRILFGLIPIRLRRCPCGRWVMKSGDWSRSSCTCGNFKHRCDAPTP